MPLADVGVGARPLWQLLRLLRNPIGPRQARAILTQRFERRESDFLDLARRAIFAQPANPFRHLLGLAGSEYGDFERLVSSQGVEEALTVLHRDGVYLTVDELKGRRAVIRDSARIAVDPSQLRNPSANVYLGQQTSGSRGRPTPVPVDLTMSRVRAVNRCLAFDARDGGVWLLAVWFVPGGDALIYQFTYSCFGAIPVRWFSPVDPAAPGLHPRYRWSERALRRSGRLAGVRLASPCYVPSDDPLPIARWLAEVLAGGRIPHLVAFTSPAVRLCQAAFKAGIPLQGARFSLVGEPLASARQASIRRVGVEAWSDYSSIETGPIGDGCARPAFPDDVHIYHDLVALIQPERQPSDLTSPARLFVSTLRPEAPLVLLNVSLGDRAVLSQRRCGCPLKRLGWTTHRHTIHSFEKLTAGGMTFLDADVIQVLEEALPNRFGGGPTGCQLLEEERADGRPESPPLGPSEARPTRATAVTEAFLAAIGAGGGAERIMALQRRQAGLPRVERRAPLATTTGKILHLHQFQQSRHPGNVPAPDLLR